MLNACIKQQWADDISLPDPSPHWKGRRAVDDSSLVRIQPQQQLDGGPSLGGLDLAKLIVALDGTEHCLHRCARLQRSRRTFGFGPALPVRSVAYR